MTRKKTAKPEAGVEEAPAFPSPEPEVVVSAPAPEHPRDQRPAAEEIAELEKHIAVMRERILVLQSPFQEFPKMVNGLTVANAEQEAAVLAGTATVEVVASAKGDIQTVK